MKAWLKMHWVCPCYLLSKKCDRARGGCCLLCFLGALLFPDIKTACAAEDGGDNKNALPGFSSVPMETVQIMPLPSTVAMRFLGVKGPQSILLVSINANERNQRQWLKDNPYANKRTPQVYKYAF